MSNRLSIVLILSMMVLASGCISFPAVTALTDDVREGEFKIDAEILERTPVSVTFPPAHYGCFKSPKVCNVQVATVVDGKTRFEAWCVIMAVSKETGEYVPIGAWRRTKEGWERVEQKESYELIRTE